MFIFWLAKMLCFFKTFMGVAMDTSRLEVLLERLIDKQDELIARVENLEFVLTLQVQSTNTCIEDLTGVSREIHEELVWWGEGHSLAKELLSRLDAIDSSVCAISL